MKQQEVELAHCAVTDQQVHKLEALYTLEKAYQTQLLKVAARVNLDQMQVEQCIFLEQIESLCARVFNSEALIRHL